MNERVSGMDEFWSPLFCVDGKKICTSFLILEEEYNAYYQPYTGANSPLLGGVFSLMIRWTKSEPILAWRIHPNLHACGILEALWFFFLIIIIAKKSFDLQSSCA